MKKLKLIELIEKLIKEKFYGVLELRFEKGEVVHIRKTENIKP